MKKIIILDDGETWSLLHNVVVAEVSIRDYEKLLDGEKPKHIKLHNIKNIDI